MAIKTTTVTPKPIPGKDLKQEDAVSVKADEVSEMVILEGDADAAMTYADHMAFMAEKVEVTLLPTADPEDRQIEEISINGKGYWFRKGEPKVVPRFVLAALIRMKKEGFSFGYQQSPDGRTRQTTRSMFSLRHPHTFSDKNPKGAAWYEEIKNQRY